MTFAPVERTQLLQITARAGSPRDASELANRYAETFIGRVDASFRRSAAPTRISVTEPAVPPTEAASPTSPLYIGFGAILALVLGAGLVLMRERLDDRLRVGAHELEVLGQPIIARIPSFGEDHSGPATVDAFRLLGANVDFAGEGRRQVLAITSSTPLEGKSTTAAHLALAAAQNGESVVLVEADLRLPGLRHTAVGSRREPAPIGLTNYLAGTHELEDVIAEHSAGLSVVWPGPLPPNPTRLLGSERLRTLVAELRKRFDRVIIDTSPISVGADASVVLGHADGVLFVVDTQRAGRSRVRAGWPRSRPHARCCSARCSTAAGAPAATRTATTRRRTARTAPPPRRSAGCGDDRACAGAAVAAALALALAAAWPVVAYRVHPAVFPALLAAAAVLALVVRRPAAGIALVLVLAPFTNAALAGGRPLRLPRLRPRGRAAGVRPARRAAPRADRPRLSLAVCLFVAAAGASSLAALDPAESVTSFLGVAVAAVLFFAVVQICQRREQLLVVVAGAIGGLLVAGAQGVTQKLSGRVSEAGVLVGDELVGRVAGSFSHPNQFAGYLIALIPLALTLAVDRRATSPALRRLAALAATLALAAVAFSFTRGAVAGLVAGGLVWLAVVRPRVAVVALVAVAIGGAMLTPAALKDRLTDPGGEDLGLRADLWRSALDLFAAARCWASASATSARATRGSPAPGRSAGVRQRQILLPPHANNLFLTILAEEGIIGALAFLGLLGAALWSCARAARREDVFDRALGVGIGAGLCALLAHSLLEYTLFGEIALPLFALLGVLAVREGASG